MALLWISLGIDRSRRFCQDQWSDYELGRREKDALCADDYSSPDFGAKTIEGNGRAKSQTHPLERCNVREAGHWIDVDGEQ